MKQQLEQYHNQAMMNELKVELPFNDATSPTPSGTAATSPTHDASKQPSNNSRAPKCTRCRNHGVISDLRGHKHKCYWRDCSCTKCLISSDRQRATADRIALFRQQVRQISAEDRHHRREKRKYSNLDEDVSYLTSMTTKIPSPNAHPPSLHKMTSSSSNHCPPPQDSPYYWSDEKTTRNTPEILRMIFPFYEPVALSSISRENNYDLLQSVLSISSYLLEKRQSSSSYYRPPHSPPPPPPSSFYKTAHASGRCCSSPYCPVNSYLTLRKKSPEIMQHLPTPPLTAVSPSYDRSARSERSETNQPVAESKPKKFRFSTDTELPYCDACQKFGIKGDKFCPLCGILFSN
ncbi:doublesex and mab-3 related transcription factor 1-like [Clytia hemisphaerica]|uniref:DM domain-containing protein n=1 Tax=Clytia hemisphaerica TaxID=252671 RepID=A0A7M5ULQ7_9CNID|eukprot:TCONS_00071068-protein